MWTPGARADPPRKRAVLVRARHGLQPLRAPLARHRARADDAGAARGSHQDLPAQACATNRRAGAASRSPRMSSGCWDRRAPPARRTSSPSMTPTAARCSRAIPGTTAFPGVAFADLRGAQTEFTCDRGEFLGRHGTLDAPAALVSGGAAVGHAPAPDSIPARRCARGSSSNPRRPPRSCSCSARPRAATKRARCSPRYRGADIDEVARRRCASTGTSSPVTCR